MGTGRRGAPERKEPESAVLRHGVLVIDSCRREVKVGEQEIQLAPKEFDLLWELLDHRGLVLTRDRVRFFVSPLSGFITGEILDLNGGLQFD